MRSTFNKTIQRNKLRLHEDTNVAHPRDNYPVGWQAITMPTQTEKVYQTDVPFEAVLVFAAIADVEPNPTAAIASAAVELTKTSSRRN